MYSFIFGKIESKLNNELVISTNGIGYEIFASNTTISDIGNVGETVKVYTYLHVREDAMLLYGFSSLEEKNIFLQLITVSGIGAKTAIGILSNISYSQLISAVVTGNVEAISGAKGVGKKSAERIILELKGKLGNIELNINLLNSAQPALSSPQSEAIDLLVTMGLTKYDAQILVNKVSTQLDTTEEIVAKSLKSMR